MTVNRSGVLDLEVHSAVTTPLGYASALYTAAMAASFWHRPLAIDTIAVCAAMGVTLAAIARRTHPTVLMHLGVTLFASAAWMAWAQAVSPFTSRAAIPFAILLVLLGPMYWAVTAADRRERRAALENASRLVGKKAARGDWPGMLAALGAPGIDVERTLESRAGYVKILKLPAHGHVTYERIRGLIKQLEVVLAVQRGCVRVVPGEDASLVQVHVVTRDVMAETIDLPDDDTPISVNRPFPVGVDETGEEFQLLWRQIATIIAGLRGKGKSNLANVLIAQLARCVDVVIWVIDLKGGRTARPWLAPWLEGRTARPVVDWVATTVDEANLMLETALKAVQIRAHSGAGGEMIEPTAEQPAIIILCEEVATLVGMHAEAASKPRSLLMSITQLGRSEAVDPILITQRNTVTMTGSGDLISQCPRRIALGVSSVEDARLVTGETASAAAIAALRHPGSMYVRDGDVTPVPVKGFRVVFERISTLAERRSRIRPGLEPSLESALGDVYTKRWERAGHLVDGSVLPAKQLATSVAAAPVAAATLPLIPKPPADARPTYRTGQGIPIPRGNAKLSKTEVDAMFADLERDLTDVTGNARAVHPGRARMLGILEAAGRAGLGPSELTRRLNEAGIDCVRQTVHTWLSDEAQAGNVISLGGGIYVHRTHAP